METTEKTIGQNLRRIFAAVTRRPMGWNLINAFTHLEEREEGEREACETPDRPFDSGA
jgi:hypothetical protein